MSAAWRALAAEIARWRDAGRALEFWWRDDDAARPAPALDRLLALAQQAEVPLALAVIPDSAVPELFAPLGDGISILQHGADHRNRAGPREKKSEFTENEAPPLALARLAAARSRLAVLSGGHALAVLAPPWNRLAAALVPRLVGAGFRGLSGYGARAAAEPAPGLRQVNAHVDLLAWRGGGGFAGEEAALGLALRHLEARRSGRADPAEPTGWLTHHARHDPAAWDFLARLFETTRREPGVRWLGAEALFGRA